MYPYHFRLLFAICLLSAVGPRVHGETPTSHEPVRSDQYGDPLPRGATARFGSLRWRTNCAIETVAVSPDGKQVAAIDMHGLVSVRDGATGRELYKFKGSSTGEESLAFSPDGRYLAT